MDITKYIERFISDNNLNPKRIVSASWKFSNWTSGFDLGNSIAIIYEIVVIANVLLMNNIETGLLTIKSRSGQIDYTHLLKMSDCGGYVQFLSDEITQHHTKLNIIYNNNNVAANIKSGYVRMIILEGVMNQTTNQQT